MLGLRELRRLLVPGGQLLLEHVLSHRPLLGPIMGLLNPLVVRMMGANINRETIENVRRAGFTESTGRRSVAGCRQADRGL